MIGRLRAAAVAAALLVAGVGPASSQSAPGWVAGFVPTPAQWNAAFASKQDYLGSAPLPLSGGTMTGRLTTAASTTSRAGLSISPGVAPTSPNNGDVWTTSSSMFARINGATVDLLACSGCARINAINKFTAAQIINPSAAAASNAATIFTVNANTVALPDWVNGVGEQWIAQIGGPDGLPMVLGLDSVGTGNIAAFSTLDLRRANGAMGARSAIKANDYIGVIGALGAMSPTTYSCGSAQINFLASTSDWSPSDNGSIILFGTTASGTVSCVSHAKVMKIDQNGYVAMGPLGSPTASGAPAARLHVSNNATWAVPNDLDSVLQVVGANGAFAGVTVNSFGRSSILTLRSAANTAASPSQTTAGLIGAVTGQAFVSGSTYTPGNSQVKFLATQTQTSSNQGQAVALSGTPDNTNAVVEQMRAQNGVSVGLTAQPGFGVLNALNGLTVNGDPAATLAASNSFTGANTFTVAAAEAVKIRSGSSGSYADMTIGRTSAEGDIAIAAASNQTLTGTVAGDMAIRAGASLWLGANGAGTNKPGVKIDTGGLLTFPQYGAGVLQSSAGGVVTSDALATTSLTGTLQAAQEPAHTGDVTNTAGSLAMTLAAGNAGNLNSGTLLAARMPALTGDVTTSAGGVATTLATAQAAVHTWALAQTFTVAPVFTDQPGSRAALGLGTAATQNTGTSGANVALLNGANTWSSAQTLSAALTYGGVTLSNSVVGTGSMVLSSSPTLVTPALGTPSALVLTNATGLPAASLTGTLQAAQAPAFTGDVTSSAGTLALSIASNAVTLAKLATQGANTVLANATSGSAVPTALAVGSCDTATKALQWTTNTGFGCNSAITAAAAPISGLTGAGSGILAWMATPSSANLAAAMTDEAGSGLLAFTTEGSWTPAISTDGTAGSPTYSVQNGSYERIGRQVTVRFSINVSGWTGGPTGNVVITGLPVTSTSAASDPGTCHVGSYVVAGLSALNYGIGGTILSSSTTILLRSNGNAATSTISAAQAGTTPILNGACSYRA